VAAVAAAIAAELTVAHAAPRSKSAGVWRSLLVMLVGFALFATTATRQLVWLGPLCFYLLRQLGRRGSIAVSRRVSLPLLAGAATALVSWAVWLGPAPNEPKLMSDAADYAAAHPAAGRLAAPSGTGSYLLWRAPRTQVTVDGRFENYSEDELEGAYDVVNHTGDWRELISRWNITRVVSRNPRTIGEFVSDGWRARYRSQGHFVLDPPAPG
jgi:hypothetical protein